MARMTLDRSVKFKRLCRELDLPKPYVRGLLETLWDCGHECGDPVLGDAEDVEHAAEWPGDPGRLFAALRDGSWIESGDDGRTWEIHDYWDHAPEYVRKRRQRELVRHDNGSKLRQTADNGGQRRTTAPNGGTPTPTPTQTTTPPLPPPRGGNDGFPDWCRKVKLPPGASRDSVLAMVLEGIEAISGRLPPPHRCATDAKSILSLWRAVGKPSPGEFLADIKLVAKAARECPAPIFARDVRAEGWPEGVDRRHSVTTLTVHRRWSERLEAAMRWEAQQADLFEQDDPHSPVRHGRRHWNGEQRWCSRAGGFIAAKDWTPLEPQEGVAH